MKAMILKATTVACLPGSVVEITEGQFKALGRSATIVNAGETPEANAEATEKRRRRRTDVG